MGESFPSKIGGAGIAPTLATETGATLTTDGTGNKYSFTQSQAVVTIVNRSTSAANLLVKVNKTETNLAANVGTTIALGYYHFELVPGQTWISKLEGWDGVLIDYVYIFADAAATYGTDFVVHGIR